MNTKLELGVPVSPSTKITLESLGKRQNVVCNYGGRTIIVYGNIIEKRDESKFIVVELTETNRKITMYHNWISLIEEVELWKQTNYHENENFEKTNPIINYYITMGGVKLTQINEHRSELPRSPLLEKIEYGGC